MFGWGRIKLPAFLKLSYLLICEAWKQTRHIQTGDDIQINVSLRVGEQHGETEEEH